MTWKPDGPQGNESGKIKWELPQYTRGTVLDLGAGTVKPWPHFISVDAVRPDGLGGLMVDVVRDCTDLSVFASQSVDAVFSSHLLEHIEDTEKTLAEWWRVIKQGGHLVLYLPHKDLYPRVGEPGANPDHKHDFDPVDIISVMESLGGLGWDLLRNEVRDQDNEYSFFQVYRKRNDRLMREPWRDPKPARTAAVVRYGGFGDMLQAASVLPGLKEQGYYVVFYTTPRGKEIIKNDPHVNEWYIQDDGQVPLDSLHLFFQNERKKYDKFVNLTETVETTLLPASGLSSYFWPKEARHKLCNHNYLEMTHRVAEVPPVFTPTFWPTEEERKWAVKERAKIRGRVILWSLAGSSVHKIWPYMDTAFARMLLSLDKDWHIVTAGNKDDQLLESPWREEPRVIRTAGKWSIRQTLAFVPHADLVIGPETGVMNSAAFLPVPKILLLSHSSIENLSKHWVNAISLEPQDCDCYPCHKLHLLGANNCKRDEETGTTACQARISIDSFMNALYSVVKQEREERVA